MIGPREFVIDVYTKVFQRSHRGDVAFSMDGVSVPQAFDWASNKVGIGVIPGKGNKVSFGRISLEAISMKPFEDRDESFAGGLGGCLGHAGGGIYRTIIYVHGEITVLPRLGDF